MYFASIMFHLGLNLRLLWVRILSNIIEIIAVYIDIQSIKSLTPQNLYTNIYFLLKLFVPLHMWHRKHDILQNGLQITTTITDFRNIFAIISRFSAPMTSFSAPISRFYTRRALVIFNKVARSRTV